MKLDLHFHTEYSYQGEVGHKESDSYITMAEVPVLARLRGLDGIVITDHMTVEAGKEKFQKVQEQNPDITLLRGMEYHSDHGHLLLYGIENDDVCRRFGKYGPAQEAIDFVNDLGGAVVPSHPYKKGYAYELSDRLFQLKGIAALEVINGNLSDEMNELAQQAAKELHIPGTGGSDAHMPFFGPRFQRNVYTVFKRKVESNVQLVAAIRESRTYAAEPVLKPHSFPFFRSIFQKVF